MNHEINCYSFYDVKNEMYDTPFFANNDLFAKRHYYLVSAKIGSMMNTFCEDFKLVRIGKFIPKEGKLIETPATEIMNGKHLRKQLDERKPEGGE